MIMVGRKWQTYLENAFLVNLFFLFVLSPYEKKVGKFCFIFGIIIWLSINIVNYGRRFYQGFAFNDRLIKPMFSFLLAGFISVVFSQNFYHSQSIFFERYIIYFLFFAMGSRFAFSAYDPKKLSYKNVFLIILAVFVSQIIFATGALWDYFRLRPLRIWTVFGREIPFKMFPLYVTYFMPMSFSFALFNLEGYPNRSGDEKGNLPRYFPWLVRGAVLGLIIMTPVWIFQGSRASWIAVAVSLMSMFLIRRNKKFFFIVLLAVIVIVVLLSLSGVERVRTLVTMDAFRDRPAIMKSAVDMLRDYPLFGAGLGMYEKFFPRYWAPPEGYQHCSYIHAHNSFIEIAAETGVVGLCSFLWVFVMFLRGSLRFLSQEIVSPFSPVLMGIYGLVVSSLFFALSCSIITVGVQGAFLFWLLMGMASGIITYFSRDNHFRTQEEFKA